ncbi:MAG: hypothetical protein Q9227_005417 [Pyrenula ochraceoflavens]
MANIEQHAPKAGNTEDIAQVERTVSNASEMKKDHMNYERVDKELAKYASSARVEVDDATSRRLRKMIDKRVLAIMITTYFLQALDKGTLSFTSIMGLPKETGLHGQQYSWLTTCIYIAVLIVEYPTNWIIQRVPIAKYLGINIILWGMILACHAAATNFAGLVVLRTLLGIFEAACQPSFVLLSSIWYKRSEQNETVTYWYMMNGMQQIVGGLLAYCFSLIKPNPHLNSWQSIFITYGTISVIWGVFVIWWMPDSPMRAKCFSEEDKHLMVERVRSNQTGLQNRKFRPEQVIEALKDPQTWCYAGIAVCTTLPTSGLGAYANIIIKSFGFTTLQTQLLAMVLGFYIIIVLLSSAWLVKRYNQNCLVMLGYMIPSFIGTILLMTVTPTTHSRRIGLLICYYIALSFWSAQTLTLSMISRNIGGQSKKAAVIAIQFIFWAAGNASGAQVFLSWDKPRYFIAFATHLGCYSLLVLILIFLRSWLKRQNALKDKALLAEAGVPSEAVDDVKGEDGQVAEKVRDFGVEADPALVHAFDDLTDRKNKNFRYIY